MGQHEYDDDPVTRAWLAAFIADHGAVAGSVHRRCTPDAPVLELAAAVNIPTKVQEVTRVIPKGKGMAGLAWERHAPVRTCNVQSDDTGDVRPGAKVVEAQAAVALPVHDAAGRVRAVVGIAYSGERELGDDEVRALAMAAAQLPV